MAFDIIVIGHVAIDVSIWPWGTIENVLGGAPTYSGLALVALKRRVGAVSKVGRDFLEKFPPIYGKLGLDTEGILVSGDYTTTFENTYDEEGNRVQVCRHAAPPINPQDIPQAYLDAAGFYVSPIVNEAEPELLKSIKKESNWVMFDPQGALREIGRDGEVRVEPKDLAGHFRYVDVVKIGKEEVACLGEDVESAMEKIRKAGPKIVIVTKGGEPSLVLSEEGIVEVHTLKVDVKDMTGAGDVFGAAFLSRYMATHSVLESVKFATAAAGLKIRYRGPVGFPSESEVSEAASRVSSESAVTLAK
jgi:sugar/nucleoside kinase (ribokinase family)